MVKDILETPDWADADLDYDQWHYWKTASEFGNLMQVVHRYEAQEEVKSMSVSQSIRPAEGVENPGIGLPPSSFGAINLNTMTREMRDYTVQIRMDGQEWKEVSLPHFEQGIRVMEDSHPLGWTRLEIQNVHPERGVEVRVDGEYVDRVNKTISVFDRLAKADGDDTTRMEALTKTVIERGSDFFNPDASPYAETQAARETNNTAGT